MYMKKYFLTKLNFLLGAASIGLIGCNVAKSSVQTPAKDEPFDGPKKYGPPTEMAAPTPEQQTPPPDEPTPVMYGAPLPD
jgi:hypothetical protein